MAVLSVTVPDAAVARIRSAVAKAMNVPDPATLAQVSDYVRQNLRALCVQAEQQARRPVADTAADTAVSTDFPEG